MMRACRCLLMITAFLVPALSLRADEPGDRENIAESSAPSIDELPIDEYDREHWAFLPLESPMVPRVTHNAWAKTPVDRFILEPLEANGLQPLPEADRYTLIRRLKFDLIGLPPTLEEIQEFVNDDSPGAYIRLVDAYLASPAYGERWSQHWLDLARFAETDGFEHDKVRPDAWRYRQWVIDSLNAGMSYRDFVANQLAGDLIEDGRHRTATMFALSGPDMPDINEQDLRRHDKLNELTSTVGSVLLGLQMGCAQCHDHKYDPISQADFYRLRTIFESAVPLMKRDRHVLTFKQLAAPVAPFVYGRGELEQQGPRVEARPPRVLCDPANDWGFATKDARLEFIRWLFDDENPIVARVIANRMWQFHFGKSLAGNPSDFGLIADSPSHPELLDWLAIELRDTNWDLKHLHRQIVLSAVYRQQSDAIDDSDASLKAALKQTWSIDPGNDLYSRFPRRRLDGEVIRDTMLEVSGQLHRHYGGTSVMPPLPQELVSTLLRGQWKASEDPRDHVRRSIYTFARRNLRFPIYDVFDRPDAGSSCPIRNESTTALQALQLMNSDFSLRAATHLASWIRTDLLQAPAATTDTQITQLFLKTLGRPPKEYERTQLESLLEQYSDPDDAWIVICLGLMNASEFIYID